MSILTGNTQTWQFVNSFAAWFSALGSFTASGVALYLARRRELVRLRVTCDTASSVMGKYLSPGKTEAFYIDVVNLGFEPVKIENVIWHQRFPRKRRQHIDVPVGQSTVLPAKLEHGDVGSFYWKPAELISESDVVINFLSNRRFPSLSAAFFRVGVITTTGKVVSVKPHREMISALLAASRNEAGR